MTLASAQAQRDQILASMGITKTQYENRSIEFSSGDFRIKEIAYLDALILKLSSPGTSSMCTYGSSQRS